MGLVGPEGTRVRTLRPTRLTRPTVLLVLALAAAGCSRGAAGTPAITLTDSSIDITGLPSATLTALERAGYTDEQWQAVFRVAVGPDAPPMLGAYAIDGGIVRFTPAFPLNAGRQYEVRFDPAGVAGAAAGEPISTTIGRPAANTTPTTVVARIYPTADVVPANVLRMYIEFSGPMGRKSGVEYIKLLDESGREIPGAVLPLDYEFWSPDHKRFTVFFDPGRVKEGILPNREMGRAFTSGRTVTLVVSREWRDEHGLPLKEDYRRTFRAAPADEQPIDPKQWQIAPPPASGREPVVVTFPEPLDQSLLTRALGIRRDGQPVAGETRVDANETRWSFTPQEPWRAGTYHLLALDILEDLAGNQVGRAFEVDNFDTVDRSPDPETITIPFVVR